MCNSLESLFGGRHVEFFGYARVAMLRALDLLGLGPEDEVLAPDYVCDSVVAPFHHRGIRIAYYPVRDDLQADLAAAEARASSRTRAFLSINYFGFAQDYAAIKAFCMQRELPLIEDNAHGFLSGDGGGLLGRHGDVAVCSFRKSLLLPDGAALVVNRPDLLQRAAATSLPLTAPRLADVARNAVKALDLHTGGGLLRLHRRRLQARDGPQVTEFPDEEFVLDPYFKTCSWYSRCAVRLLNIERFRRTARARFAAWHDYLQDDPGIKPLWHALPAGTVPWVFAFRAEDPQASLSRILAETGARGWVWPRLLPQAVRQQADGYPPFYRQIAGIPLGGENARQVPAVRPRQTLDSSGDDADNPVNTPRSQKPGGSPR